MNTFEAGKLEMDVILYQEDGGWIAQGLQFDITASGKSPADAARRFDIKIGAEIAMSFEVGDESPLSGVPSAPPKFWEMFKQADMRVSKEQPTIIRIAEGARTAAVHSRMKIGEKIAA